MTTRRSFVATLSLAAFPGLARRRQPNFQWTRILPGVHTITGNGGNSVLITGADASVLVDAKSFGFGAALRREVAEQAVPLRTLILTHHHFDHAGGSDAFAELTVVGHENARQRCVARARQQAADLARFGEPWVEGYLRNLRGFTEVGVDDRLREELLALARRPDAVVAERFGPTQTINRESTLRTGGVEMQLRHAGAGHTDNDVFVFLPRENLLKTGDLLFHGFHPFIDVSAGATTVGWERSLAAMLELCNDRTIVVAGHGALTGRAALEAQRDYFRRGREFVGNAMREGRTRDEITRLVPPGFESLGWPDGLPRNMGTFFDELR